MRTKVYLAALCLPLAFAACTNEDFINEKMDLNSRGEIDVTIKAVKGAEGQADTRLDISGSNFMWEAGVDVIGAALVDAGILNTVQNTVPVNYPFTADQSGATSTFSGKSSVSQGSYFFYYGYQDNLNRGLLNLNVPEQVYKAGDTKDAKRQAVAYMKGISPIVNLSEGITFAGAQSAALDLRFVPLYTLVKVNINSSNIPAGVTPTVTKVTLNSVANPFVSKAAANMTMIAAAGIIPLTEEGAINAAKRDAFVNNLKTLVANQNVYGANYNNGTVAGVAKVTGPAVLKVDGEVKLEAGKTTSLYILAPKGTYGDLKLEVLTSEGKYVRNINQTVTLADAEQPIAANLDFDRANGNVEAVTTFTIASGADWDEAVAFINEHPTSYVGRTITFDLVDDIEVSNMPNYNLTITGTQEIKLTSDYTVNEANKGLYTANNITWVVAEGATMNINAVSTTFVGIRNEGALNISANTAANIVNYGTMNVNSDVTISGNVENGKDKETISGVEYAAISGTINIAKEKVLIVDANLTNVEGSIVVGESAALAMATNATVTNAFLNKKDATLTVNGFLTSSGSLANAPTFTNNEGVIDMYGKLDVKLNNANGTLILQSAAYSVGTTGATKDISNGTVEIMDIDAFAQTQLISNKKFNFGTSTAAPKVTTSVSNGAEYDKADALTFITDITLNGGTWTIAASTTVATNSKTIKNPTNATSLTLNGANLKLNTQDLTTKLETKGTSALLMASGTSTAKVDGKDLKVISGTLTVNNKVKFNGTSSNTSVAQISGTLNVEAGAAMYFKSVTVDEGGQITVKGETNTVAAGIFGVSTTAQFDNKGTVESKAATKTGGGAAGQVTTPTNDATGVFKGNGSNITMS